MTGGFVIIKYYPNREFEDMHEMVGFVATGADLDSAVLKLEDEQEKFCSFEYNYFDIVTLPIVILNERI